MIIDMIFLSGRSPASCDRGYGHCSMFLGRRASRGRSTPTPSPPPPPPPAPHTTPSPPPSGLPEPSRLEALRELLQVNQPLLLRRDPLIRQYITCIRTAPMQDDWYTLIPDPLRESWSTLALVMEKYRGKTISLTSMRRQVQKLALGYAISRKAHHNHTPRQLTPPWWDPEGMVKGMVAARQMAHDGPEYDRHIPTGPDHRPTTDFQLTEWVREHQRICAQCQQWPSFAAFCAHNQDNPCYFSHLLAWVYGKWRFPLTERPPAGRLDNYESFGWSPVYPSQWRWTGCSRRAI